MPFSSTKEERIHQLENQLSNLKMTSAYGSNCEIIARIQLQLMQLYAQSGNKMLSDQMLSDARKTLQDPLCPKTKASEQMLRTVEYYISHPGIIAMQSMPAIYRYLSFIVLLGGYLVLYLVHYLFPIYFVYQYFLVGIVVVFILSFVVNYAVRNLYMRKVSKQQL